MAIIKLSAEQAGNSALISDFPSHLLKIAIRIFPLLNVERRPDKTASHG